MHVFCVFGKMEKTDYRAVVTYLHLKDMLPSEINKDIQGTLQEDAPSYATVKSWAKEFKRGNEGVKDGPWHGRPATGSSAENIDLILVMAKKNRLFSARQTVEKLDMSQERVENFQTNELCLKSVFVPRVKCLFGPKHCAHSSGHILLEF